MQIKFVQVFNGFFKWQIKVKMKVKMKVKTKVKTKVNKFCFRIQVEIKVSFEK